MRTRTQILSFYVKVQSIILLLSCKGIRQENVINFVFKYLLFNYIHLKETHIKKRKHRSQSKSCHFALRDIKKHRINRYLCIL